MNMDNVSFTSLFASPLMEIHLDLDLEKLTEFAFEMKNVDKIGKQKSNRGGGWHSDNILEEKMQVQHYTKIDLLPLIAGSNIQLLSF